MEILPCENCVLGGLVYSMASLLLSAACVKRLCKLYSLLSDKGGRGAVQYCHENVEATVLLVAL